jgi:hypothetical protein
VTNSSFISIISFVGAKKRMENLRRFRPANWAKLKVTIAFLFAFFPGIYIGVSKV